VSFAVAKIEIIYQIVKYTPFRDFPASEGRTFRELYRERY